MQVLDVGANQEELKTGALNFIEKGKQLTHDRIKLIRFADRDGWTAALNFLGDQIAETEAEAKAMRKGKKEADRFRDSRRNSWGERFQPYSTYNRRNQAGASRDRDDYSTGYRPRDNRYKSYNSDKKCFECQRYGHIARFLLGLLVFSVFREK